MKKSFKKAGAAVLSMAMLLSMGAVTLPVYADNPTGATPGQVWVRINGVGNVDANKQGEGDGTGVDQELESTSWKYDYLSLKNVTEATVKVYRVAEFNETGWNWVTNYRPATNKDDGFTDWETLFAKDAESGNFTAASSDLKKLASTLERNLTNTEKLPYGEEGSLEVGSGKIDYAKGQEGIYLPVNRNELMNKIGYYLIVTETNQAGVIVQPVLVSLKNDASNPKEISLKGTTISVDKKIITVKNNDDTKDWAVADAVTSNGKSAVVAKNDKVHYELYARIPKYDENATNISDFVLEDIADNGIIINTSSITAYLSTDDESTMSSTNRDESKSNNWDLTRGVNSGDFTIDDLSTNDSELSEENADNSKSNGFKFIITKEQLRGKTSGSTVNTENNKTEQETMENLYLVVGFDATINESAFNKGYSDDKVYKDLTAEKIGAVSREEILEILSGQETRYQSILVNYSNENLKNFVNDNDETPVLALKDIVNKATDKEWDADSADILKLASDYVLEGVDVNSVQADIDEIKNELNITDDDAKAVYAILKEHYIRANIALDKDNATLNGENNRAKLTYGNNYSTGAGAAEIPTDVTTLYSVDVNFTKFTTGVELTQKTPASYGIDEIVDFIQTELKERNGYADVTDEDTALTALKNDTADDVAELTAAIDDTENADNITAMLDALNGNETDDKDAAKLALALINKYNDDKGYDATDSTTKVVGAVFKLTKVYNRDSANTENNQLLELGYAISDDNGVLRVLTANAYDAGNPIPEGVDVKYLVETDETSGMYYTLETGAAKAWTTLTTGNYELDEVSVPAGYKKWSTAATFEITGVKDAAGNYYTGKYTAKGTSTAYSSDGTTSVEREFTTDDANGVLSTNIYNVPNDTLPATGGMGTVLFTAGGIAVVLMAGALFVVYMKKRNAEEE